MKDSNLLNLIQYFLTAMAFCCVIIAIVTILFGEKNFLQTSPYPSLGLVILFLGIWIGLDNKTKE